MDWGRQMAEFLVHSFYFSQDLALVHGKNGAVVPYFLKHGPALELVAGLLEVVPVGTEDTVAHRGLTHYS